MSWQQRAYTHYGACATPCCALLGPSPGRMSRAGAQRDIGAAVLRAQRSAGGQPTRASSNIPEHTPFFPSRTRLFRGGVFHLDMTADAPLP